MARPNTKKTNTALIAAVCTALAATTNIKTGFAVGIATSIVLILTNILMGILKNKAPNNMLILFYIVFSAFFVSITHFIFQAYFPEISNQLGIYIPITFTVCLLIQLVQGGTDYSIGNSIQISIEFILLMVVIGALREWLGSGIPSMALAPGALITLGFVLAVISAIYKGKKTT